MMKLRLSSASRRRPGDRPKGLIRRFAANRSGTTAIEFAMIAVPFIGLIAAVFETGNVYFQSSQLQLTTETAGRSVLTSSLAAGITYQKYVDDYICTWKAHGVVNPGTLGRSFDCDKLIVDIRSPGAWGSTYDNSFYTTASPRGTVISLPGSQQIAIVRIVYPVSAVASILTGGVFSGQSLGTNRTGQVQYSGNNNQWSHMIMGIYAFKVE